MLNLYICKFSGCLKDAIGTRNRKQVRVVAENEENARLALYDDFDHIMGLECTLDNACKFKQSEFIPSLTIISYLDGSGWHLQKGAIVESLDNFVSDSIIGQLVNLEGWTMLSNNESKRRTVRVLTDTGRTWVTEINGTMLEVGKHFLGQSFEYDETKPTDKAIKLEFLK
jgi:hypothetical protein